MADRMIRVKRCARKPRMPLGYAVTLDGRQRPRRVVVSIHRLVLMYNVIARGLMFVEVQYVYQMERFRKAYIEETGVVPAMERLTDAMAQVGESAERMTAALGRVSNLRLRGLVRWWSNPQGIRRATLESLVAAITAEAARGGSMPKLLDRQLNLKHQLIERDGFTPEQAEAAAIGQGQKDNRQVVEHSRPELSVQMDEQLRKRIEEEQKQMVEQKSEDTRLNLWRFYWHVFRSTLK